MEVEIHALLTFEASASGKDLAMTTGQEAGLASEVRTRWQSIIEPIVLMLIQ